MTLWNRADHEHPFYGRYVRKGIDRVLEIYREELVYSYSTVYHAQKDGWEAQKITKETKRCKTKKTS